MKSLYYKPVITVETLAQQDVLCASSPVDPTKFDNAVSSGSGKGPNDLYDLSNVI